MYDKEVDQFIFKKIYIFIYEIWVLTVLKKDATTTFTFIIGLSFIIENFIFKNNINNHSCTYDQWINYFYQTWFGAPPIRILCEYCIKKKLILLIWEHLSTWLWSSWFWDLAKSEAFVLWRLAHHPHEICINTASIERLWSNMGFIHSKKGNCLYVCKKKNFSTLSFIIKWLINKN